MVAFSRNDELLDFTPLPDTLPPREEEAEEAILGGILFDPQAIHRVWHRLKPEHFQNRAHKDIYEACIRLAKKNQPTDFITLSSYLNDSDLLKKVGGRSKLISLLDRTVSTVNIDLMAGLVIEKAVRRDLIRVGQDAMRLGYDTFLSIEEVLESFKRKARVIVELETVKTEDELIISKHNYLLEKIKRIHMTVSEPSLKYMRLKYLADEWKTSIPFLDSLYQKSLVASCTKLMDYGELKEAAGSSVRRWFQQGLIPQGSTILLAADGGIGKTKLAYSLAKNLIEGKQFGDFLPTGEKRRILFYQGDEQEGDMLQSLQMLGYEEGDIAKHIRVRFGWSFENMATLTQDINEFKPDFVVCDSISFGSRFSTVKESDSEYARPLLEANALANFHNCTFLFIHHANKAGEVRGTTAIRNAVSEVWRLSKDSSPNGTQYDRILEIDKSRSRSSGKKYRLYFDPDTLSFNFLGEEVDASSDMAARGTRGKILDFFGKNPNVKYTSEELSHFLNISSGHCRRTLRDIASDGLLSVDRKPGKAYTYYLEFTGRPKTDGSAIFLDQSQQDSTLNGDQTKRSDRGDHPVHCTYRPDRPPDRRGDQRGDHLDNVETVTDTAKDVQKDHTFDPPEKSKSKNENGVFLESPDHTCPESLSVIQSEDDHKDDHRGNQQVITHEHLGSPSTEYDHQSVSSASATKLPNPIEVEINGIGGMSKATLVVTKIHSTGKAFKVECELPDGTTKTLHQKKKLTGTKQQAEETAREILTQWQSEVLASRRFKVRQIGIEDYVWVEGCKLVSLPNPPVKTYYLFVTPNGDRITVAGDDEFEVMG
jgi:replicative DNA helicase